MMDKDVKEKAKYLSWDILEPAFRVFLKSKGLDQSDLSKRVAGAIENTILEEWCKFVGVKW